MGYVCVFVLCMCVRLAAQEKKLSRVLETAKAQVCDMHVCVQEASLRETEVVNKMEDT
jgi:hypothetical protein